MSEEIYDNNNEENNDFENLVAVIEKEKSKHLRIRTLDYYPNPWFTFSAEVKKILSKNFFQFFSQNDIFQKNIVKLSDKCQNKKLSVKHGLFIPVKNFEILQF